MKDLPEKGGDRKIEREERKRIIIVLRIVLALKINYSNINSPPRIFNSSNFISVFLYCSSFKSLLSVNLFTRSPTLSPTLYKFIVLGSVGRYPRSFGLGLRIVILQYIYIYIYIYINKHLLYNYFHTQLFIHIFMEDK